jgi:hypothetical protein
MFLSIQETCSKSERLQQSEEWYIQRIDCGISDDIFCDIIFCALFAGHHSSKLLSLSKKVIMNSLTDAVREENRGGAKGMKERRERRKESDEE